MRRKYGIEQGDEALTGGIRGYEVAEVGEGKYMTLRYDDGIGELMEKTGMSNLRFMWFDAKRLRKAISVSKNR